MLSFYMVYVPKEHERMLLTQGLWLPMSLVILPSFLLTVTWYCTGRFHITTRISCSTQPLLTC